GSPFNFPSAGNGGPLAITPNGKFLFFADSFGQIVTFTIGATGGTPTLVGPPVSNPNQPIQMAVDPSGTFLYTANLSDHLSGSDFSVYSISTSGTLVEIPGSPFFALANSQPYGIVMDATGTFLF